MTNPTEVEKLSPANYAERIGLLRREGRHSGLWFAEHLLWAATMLEAQATEIERLKGGLRHWRGKYIDGTVRAALAAPEGRGMMGEFREAGVCPSCGAQSCDWTDPPPRGDRQLREVLAELANIVEGHVHHGDRLDSFTTQPARAALAAMEPTND